MKLNLQFPIVALAATISTTNALVAQTPPELNRLEYFVGSWRCQQPAASTSPSGVFTWTVKKDLNNFWYVGNAEQVETPDEGNPINSREFLGYNAANKKLMRSVVVGNGNSYNLTASDWQDRRLIWEGTIIRNSEMTPLREEIVRDSPSQFTATYFAIDDKNSWQPVVDETCKRIVNE